MLDLFDIAANNAEKIDENFNGAIASLSGQKVINVNDFAQWVQSTALISVNLRLFVIVEILNGTPYKNIHEWAQEQAELSGRKKDEILRERLKGFYAKRMTFDQAFQQGERFRYGALNAGGLGLSIYASYCSVLTSNFHNALKHSACLSGDSLDICFAKSNEFDAKILTQSIAPFSHRHALAASQLIAKIDTVQKSEWSQLLISKDSKQYFEIIFIGAVTLNDLHCVRVSANEYQQKWDLAFASFDRSLSEPERAEVQDFVQLLRAVKEGKIQLETI
jgi:hypothetical protein